MRDKFFKDINLSIKYIIALNVIIFIIMMLIGLFLYYSPPGVRHSFAKYRDIYWYGLYAIVILIVVRYKLGGTDFIGLKQSGLRKNIKLALYLTLFFYFIKYFIIYISKKYHLLIHYKTMSFHIDNPTWLIIIHITIAISIGPIIEEILFRGLFYPPLRNKLGPLPAIIICSLIFAIWHLGIGKVEYLANVFIIGILLTYLYEKTMSLIPSITAHVVINSSIFVPVLLKPLVAPQNLGKLILSIALAYLSLSVLFYVLYKKERDSHKSISCFVS